MRECKHSRHYWTEEKVNMYDDLLVFTSKYYVKKCKSCNKILERKFSGETTLSLTEWGKQLHLDVKEGEPCEPMDLSEEGICRRHSQKGEPMKRRSKKRKGGHSNET